MKGSDTDSHQVLLAARRDSARVIEVMAFHPQAYPPDTVSMLYEDSAAHWTPLYWHDSSFSSKIYTQVMMNLIRNPNLNSNHLFRADILLEVPYCLDSTYDSSLSPRIAIFKGFTLEKVMIRRLIPRNTLVDKPLNQTCLLYTRLNGSESHSLVIYFPHISSALESPFYHPAVRGIALLHHQASSKTGIISVHYSFFPSGLQTPHLDRTAQHLLRVLHKHGEGLALGYVKRVHHDIVLPQATVQNTYARLKAKYARSLIAGWVEVTDPSKHVFEDLGIAAFLIELWANMNPKTSKSQAFVDIGCGNGLLVHILIEEGYLGWGFDARKRKSWDAYPTRTQKCLKELVLIPDAIQREETKANETPNNSDQDQENATVFIHSGVFPKGTFIISNHADELTPWTPLLATLSESPFLMIPCCSHNLTGRKFRAPHSNEKGIPSSAYASLVNWVARLADRCGWEVEKEMLRIPSTRNTAILGRRRIVEYSQINIVQIIEEFGGAAGWKENAMKLVKTSPRKH